MQDGGVALCNNGKGETIKISLGRVTDEWRERGNDVVRANVVFFKAIV